MKVSLGDAVFEGTFDEYVAWCKYNNVEPKQAEPEPLKVGDYAKVIGNNSEHSAEIGDIVKIVYDDKTAFPFKCERLDGKELECPWFLVDELVLATPEEVAEAKAKLEAEKAKAEEKAKWAKIGRKVGEFKNGDIVMFTQSTGSVYFDKGSITQIRDLGGREFRFGPKNVDYFGKTSWIKLIVPVESVVNLSVEG